MSKSTFLFIYYFSALRAVDILSNMCEACALTQIKRFVKFDFSTFSRQKKSYAKSRQVTSKDTRGPVPIALLHNKRHSFKKTKRERERERKDTIIQNELICFSFAGVNLVESFQSNEG